MAYTSYIDPNHCIEISNQYGTNRQKKKIEEIKNNVVPMTLYTKGNQRSEQGSLQGLSNNKFDSIFNKTINLLLTFITLCSKVTLRQLSVPL